MNRAVIGKTQSSHCINIDAFPETLKVFVTIDAIQDGLQLEIRIIRQVNQKFRTVTSSHSCRHFKNVLELEETIEKYSAEIPLINVGAKYVASQECRI